MVTYSRLERIKERKKRKLLYRKIFRMVVVPVVFAFAILLYFSMVSENLEEVDPKEKAASHFAPDGASRDKEVAGEKTEQDVQKSFVATTSESAILSPTPKIIPTPTLVLSTAPSGKSISSKVEQPIPTASATPTQPKPTVDPLIIQLPEELKETTGNLSIAKGELSFKVIADWGEADRQLVWGNFNGRDIKNLFQIVGSGNILVSDIHGEDGSVINDECNVFFDEFANGKEYIIKVAWDFQTEPWTEKIYINDILKRECTTTLKPVDNGGKIFIGSITNFSVLNP